MKKVKKSITVLMMCTVAILLIAGSGCNKDDDTTPARTTTYTLNAKHVLGVSGTVTFTETSSNSVTIDIALTSAPDGTHPAELRKNSAVEGGAVVITLNPVDATGNSSTLETSLTYTQLIAYDGFIQVHKSTSEPDVIIAQGDIGGNILTNKKITYTLDTIGAFGVSGTALFEERVNGNTLITISVTSTIAGEAYPATINLGSIESVGGGPVVSLLSNVDGTTGKGYTNIRKLDSGMDITYENWLVYDGYINIYNTTINLNDVICHGNIGSN